MLCELSIRCTWFRCILHEMLLHVKINVCFMQMEIKWEILISWYFCNYIHFKHRAYVISLRNYKSYFLCTDIFVLNKFAYGMMNFVVMYSIRNFLYDLFYWDVVHFCLTRYFVILSYKYLSICLFIFIIINKYIYLIFY